MGYDTVQKKAWVFSSTIFFLTLYLSKLGIKQGYIDNMTLINIALGKSGESGDHP